jgi:8-oxo-dGTP pyrophosphatase MutT (NUDIX family)
MADPTSAERAARALADSVDLARPRVEADITDPDIPVAATAVLLREGADGLEVLLLERPDRGSFAGAWVFPGGKVDEADAAPAAPGEPTELASARRAAVRETDEETGLALDPAGLVALSCWDPPPGIAVRIRTWFFLAQAPDAPLRLSADEAVSARWIPPAEALAAHGRGEMILYPPTWVTLHGLTVHADAASAFAAAREDGIRTFATQVRRGADGPIFFWSEDAEYDADDPAAADGPRHRLETGALAWRYTRRD